MKVIMMGKTALTNDFYQRNEHIFEGDLLPSGNKCVALAAIRNCYSPLPPSKILEAEGKKYFGNGGKEGKRLFNHIAKSGHTSTLEHIHFTFLVEDLSRAALAQLTRHRHYGFSVKSQRYVRYGSQDKSGGFDYVVPPSVKDAPKAINEGTFCEMTALEIYHDFMNQAQTTYDALRECGVPAEDARMVLPNAVATHIVMSGNLRTILEFYSKRREGNGAQWEIAKMAEKMRDLVTKEEPWTADFFEIN